MRSLVVSLLVGGILGWASLAQAQDGEWRQLFNGKNFDGWTYDLADDSLSLKDVWSIRDNGILFCKGEPPGVLRTEETFSDYVLEVEWRWTGEPGNNGVLVHASEPRELSIWPKSIEVQLQHQNAGDFWDIGVTLDVPNEEERRSDRNVKNLVDNVENEPGEWNKIRIRCEDDTIAVWINGEIVNHATNTTATEGAICLQSEGAPIEYRNVRIRLVEKD